MRGHRFLGAFLLATLLAIGVGCGAKSAEKSADDGKSKSPAFVESHGVKIGTTATAPTAKQPIDTQYITQDFMLAAVVHPSQILNGTFVRKIQGQVEKELGKDKVESGIQMAIREMGFDPRNVKQAIFLFDEGFAQNNPFMGGGASPPHHGDEKIPRDKTDSINLPERKPRRPRPRKTEDRKTSSRGNRGETEFVFTTQPLDSVGPSKRQGAERKDGIPSGIVRFVKAPDRKMIFKTFDGIFLGPQREMRKRMREMKKRLRESRKGDETEDRARSKKAEPQKKGKSKAETPKAKSQPSKNLDADLQPVQKTHGGKTIHVFGPLAACFVDETTLLFSNPRLLKKMMAAKGVKSPLTERLSTLGAEHDLIVAADLTPIRPLLGFAAGFGGENPKLKEAIGYAMDVKTIALTAGITGDTLLSVVVQTGEAKSAAGLVKMFQAEYGKGVEIVKAEAMSKVAQFAPELQPLLTEIINGFSAHAKETDAILSVAMPKSFDTLADKTPAVVRRLQEEARKTARKNNLKQIGLAFHNFHDRYNRFPEHNSNGERKGEGRKEGLSWRVHLLPYLEQHNLYKQFNLDEPWDSATNKKLIAKMPDVFKSHGVSAPGKTSIHVFVGKGTPFDPKRTSGSRIRDFIDGTSNTLLAVEAGPDKADIWTKPGGLPFDPEENPVDSLGKIDGAEFLALMCDGYATWVKTSIKPKTLKLLVQLADRNVIPSDPALQRYQEFRQRRRRFEGKTLPGRFGPPGATAPDGPAFKTPDRAIKTRRP